MYIMQFRQRLMVLSGIVLAHTMSPDLQAQTTDFYYLGDSSTVRLSRVAGQYLAVFTDTAVLQQGPGQRIARNQYRVGDTAGLAAYGPYYLTPVLQGSADPVYYTRDIVLLFKAGTDSAARAGLIAAYGLSFVRSSTSFELYRIGSGDALQVSRAIFESGQVRYCHPDFIAPVRAGAYIPKDAYFAKQWYLHNTGGTTNDGKTLSADADIDAPEAWDLSMGDPSITIAVIDEGNTPDHQDLPAARQIRLPGSNFAYGVDGTGDQNNPSPTVKANSLHYNHGEEVAGVLAATHNTQGVAGVAPLCKIMPVKLSFGTESLPSSINTEAVDFAVKNGAKILNISWGWDPSRPYYPMQVALENAILSNRVVVAITGNTADRSTTSGSAGWCNYPGNLNIKDMLTVGASDRNNKVANYSPDGAELELVAPSHTAYHTQVPGEAENVWTMDVPGFDKGGNKWRDPSSGGLPAVGEELPAKGYPAADMYTGRFGGTSAAAPQVAGVAALMIAVNPCIKVSQVRELLQATADRVGGYDYNWNGYMIGRTKDEGYSKEMGYGKLNAYKAVKAAKAAYEARLTDKLYTKDNPEDVGITGTGSTGGGDNSPDIWVRNADNGLEYQVSEDPAFTAPGSICWVYVRVRNRSCENYYNTSSRPAQLALYWSKASSWSSWPAHWDGSKPDLGGPIGKQTIPTLLAGETAILKFEWGIPSPDVYKSRNACLLSRIENYPAEPITVYAGRLDKDLVDNNNVSMRNVTIVKGTKPGPVRGGVLYSGNVLDAPRAFNLRLSVPRGGEGVPDITREAEVRLRFDSLGWSLLQAVPQSLQQEGVQVLPPQAGGRQLLLSKPDIVFAGIPFPADTRIPIEVHFNFLAGKQTPTPQYEYTLSQAFADTPGMVLGSESFRISKVVREPFSAYAGPDATLNKGDSAVLQAQDIGEAALYRWYDSGHNLVDSGMTITVAPESSRAYTLEVTATADGFKDYDAVQLSVRQYFIRSLSPNPASTQVSVGYQASGAAAALLQISSANGTIYGTYTLDPSQTLAELQIGQLAPGLYHIFLICDGETVDASSLQVN